MKLGTEFQSRSYDAIVSHTTIVFIRYILLEWIRRNQNDQKTYGELFFMFCDDIQDMNLANALQGLMSLFTDIVIHSVSRYHRNTEKKSWRLDGISTAIYSDIIW